MLVKLDTHHWGIQGNSVVVLVKNATFQGMGSGGRGRTENGMYWVQDSLHCWKYILYFHGKYIKRVSG
jgi:hypothetical protein